MCGLPGGSPHDRICHASRDGPRLYAPLEPATGKEKSDGTFLHLAGGLPPPGVRTPGHKYGLPVKGYSFSDRQVVEGIAAKFVTVDRLVVLSANLKGDPEGLRKLLEVHVAPILQGQHRDRFGLLVLMRGRKTPWSQYAAALEQRLTTGVMPGYEYQVVPRR